MQPGSGNPGVAMGSTHRFSLMNFLVPVPSPGAALTCHSMWDVCDHHPLRLRLDACIWILHLHHKRFNLQSRAGTGHVTGVDRRVPQDHCSSGQHPRWVCATGTDAMTTVLCKPPLFHQRCHLRAMSALTLTHSVTPSYRRHTHSWG